MYVSFRAKTKYCVYTFTGPRTSLNHYERIEQIYAFSISVGAKLAFWVSFGFYVVSVCQPISYAFFNLLDPDQWILPYGYR